MTGLGPRDLSRLAVAERFGVDLVIDVSVDDPDHLVYKELRILGALGVDLPAYEAALALLVSGRYPFDELHRVSVGMNDLEPLLQVLAGLSSSDADPPVHSVFVPDL
jgi:alcohol dehydrogenase